MTDETVGALTLFVFCVLGVWFLFYVAKENFNNEALEGTEAKPIDYFKHIKFVSLVGAMVLTLLVIFAVTRGLDRGFEIIEISKYYFSFSGEFLLIISFYLPYIFLRIWEAYYRK